jgi:Fe-S-cluster containining protein
MGNFFDRCKNCKVCCYQKKGRVEVYICKYESTLKNYLLELNQYTDKILFGPEEKCKFLGEDGCSLGDIKPFQCRLFPLSLLSDGSLGIEPLCPCSDEYLSQLHFPQSDASNHLKTMKKELFLLTEEEKQTFIAWTLKYISKPIKKVKID